MSSNIDLLISIQYVIPICLLMLYGKKLYVHMVSVWPGMVVFRADPARKPALGLEVHIKCKCSENVLFSFKVLLLPLLLLVTTSDVPRNCYGNVFHLVLWDFECIF